MKYGRGPVSERVTVYSVAKVLSRTRIRSTRPGNKSKNTRAMLPARESQNSKLLKIKKLGVERGFQSEQLMGDLAVETPF